MSGALVHAESLCKWARASVSSASSLLMARHAWPGACSKPYKFMSQFIDMDLYGLLAAMGAMVSRCSSDYMLPVQVALIHRLVKRHGCSVQERSVNSWTPLHYAAAHNKVICLQSDRASSHAWHSASSCSSSSSVRDLSHTAADHAALVNWHSHHVQILPLLCCKSFASLEMSLSWHVSMLQACEPLSKTLRKLCKRISVA